MLSPSLLTFQTPACTKKTSKKNNTYTRPKRSYKSCIMRDVGRDPSSWLEQLLGRLPSTSVRGLPRLGQLFMLRKSIPCGLGFRELRTTCSAPPCGPRFSVNVSTQHVESPLERGESSQTSIRRANQGGLAILFGISPPSNSSGTRDVLGFLDFRTSERPCLQCIVQPRNARIIDDGILTALRS